ncbi:MAG TPA: ATP-binding cassette domain-containing protein [Firmicutes bacterium]|nr:ATP-binding cassette domain-containing protein [Bacillota bacterium]
MLLSIENLNKSFADKPVLKNVCMQIEENTRAGLIGVNGAGKSTLLNIIAGKLEWDDGEVNRSSGMTLGFLEQHSGLSRENTIQREMLSVFQELLDAESRMEKLAGCMASDPCAAEEYARLQSYFEQNGGYEIEVKIKMILNGMGFGDKPSDTMISTLSGGEKTRLALAKLLLEEPNLLILDEPTNHLDFKTLGWLEEYLKSYRGALLVVSHDRYFLDTVVDTIYELERGELVRYNGNYSKYTVLKEERMNRLWKEYEAQQEEIAALEEYVQKNITRASTSSMAKGRQKALERMERLDRPPGDIKKAHFQFGILQEPHQEVLTVQDLDVSVGDPPKTLCRDISLTVRRGERVAIIGENGIGKSSFLKTIQNLLPHTKGRIRWGGNVTISYYEQENAGLHPDKMVIDELWDRYKNKTELEIRKALAGVRIVGEDVYKKVGVISGGERARLCFAIIMQERSNVLILDEPTNHLDLASKELLEEALLEYEGTLIFVSHDRYLLNKVPTRIVEVLSEGIAVYDGNYEYYRRKAQEQAEQIEAQEQEKKAERLLQENKTAYRSKEQRAEAAKRRQRLREVETLIEQAETEIADMEKKLTDADTFTDYEAARILCEELEAKKNQLSVLMEEWAELAE